MNTLMRFFKEEDGLELSEYAVMGSLIIIGLLVVIGLLQGAIGKVFTDMTTEINKRPASGTGTGG